MYNMAGMNRRRVFQNCVYYIVIKAEESYMIQAVIPKCHDYRITNSVAEITTL